MIDYLEQIVEAARRESAGMTRPCIVAVHVPPIYKGKLEATLSAHTPFVRFDGQNSWLLNEVQGVGIAVQFGPLTKVDSYVVVADEIVTHTFKHTVDECECGASKTFKVPKGPGHSSWCPMGKT